MAFIMPTHYSAYETLPPPTYRSVTRSPYSPMTTSITEVGDDSSSTEPELKRKAKYLEKLSKLVRKLNFRARRHENRRLRAAMLEVKKMTLVTQDA